MERTRRAKLSILFLVIVLAMLFLLYHQQTKPAVTGEPFNAACRDPLAGVAGNLDDARFSLTPNKADIPAGATVILRLPGVDFADELVSQLKPKVTAVLDGQPARVDDGDSFAGCPSPSRTLYDAPIRIERTWATGRRLDISVIGYRLPNRAVKNLPVQFFLASGSPPTRKLVAEFHGVVSADRTVAALVDVPTIVREGSSIPLRVSTVDQFGNPSRPPGKPLFIELDGQKLASPEIALDGEGRGAVEIPPPAAGVHRFSLFFGDKELGRSGPCLVSKESPSTNYYWGDLHSHTYFSDGFTTANPADAFAYANDTAHLDFAAVTDHAEAVWGCAMSPARWSFIEEAGRRANVPGKFITLLGYEWTGAFVFGGHWPVFDGHAHVLFPDGGKPCRADTDECNSFDKLLAKMAPYHPLVIRHHVCVKWAPATFPAQPSAEMPVLEIASSHGSCECPTCPGLIPDRVNSAENYIQTALLTGVHYGLVGGSDNHHAMPGARSFAGMKKFTMNAGGLTCILAGRLSREEVFQALRERRCYATTSARIFLDFHLADAAMGQVLPRPARVEGTFIVHGVDRLAEVVIWRGDIDRKTFSIIHSVSVDGLDAAGAWRDPSPPKRGLYYLRARQTDGEMAWSSPIWIE